ESSRPSAPKTADTSPLDLDATLIQLKPLEEVQEQQPLSPKSQRIVTAMESGWQKTKEAWNLKKNILDGLMKDLDMDIEAAKKNHGVNTFGYGRALQQAIIQVHSQYEQLCASALTSTAAQKISETTLAWHGEIDKRKQE